MMECWYIKDITTNITLYLGDDFKWHEERKFLLFFAEEHALDFLNDYSEKGHYYEIVPVYCQTN